MNGRGSARERVWGRVSEWLGLGPTDWATTCDLAHDTVSSPHCVPICAELPYHPIPSHPIVLRSSELFHRVCAMEEKVGHYIDLCGFLLLLTIFCTILCLQADPTACRQVLAAHEVLLPPVSDRLSWLHQVQLLGSKAVTGCHGCNECDRVSSMVSRNTATGCCSFNLWHNCNSCQPENLLLRPPTVVPTSI